jgi:hypothetical protein
MQQFFRVNDCQYYPSFPLDAARLRDFTPAARRCIAESSHMLRISIANLEDPSIVYRMTTASLKIVSSFFVSYVRVA